MGSADPNPPKLLKPRDSCIWDPIPVGAPCFSFSRPMRPRLRFDFVYDDIGQIVDNTLVHSWRYLPDYFRGRTWIGLQGASPNYYRPLNFVWLRLNYVFWGPHPHAWHATAILLHLAATLLAYFVAREVTQHHRVAALTALFFGIHPMTHEVAAWVSGTTESLWSVFGFATFLSYLKFRRSRLPFWLLLSCGFYAAAVLSKESAITLPLLILAHAVIFGPSEGLSEPSDSVHSASRFSEGFRISACYLPVAIVYVVVRLRVLHGFSHPQERVSLGTFLLTLPSIAFFYFKQWLFPVHLSEFYDLPLSTSFTFTNVLLPLAGLSLIG